MSFGSRHSQRVVAACVHIGAHDINHPLYHLRKDMKTNIKAKTMN